jgi:hypothetical protein
MLRTISDIDVGKGIIRLSDGTRWQVESEGIGTISSWRPLSSVEVCEELTSIKLRNVGSGNDVGVRVCK